MTPAEFDTRRRTLGLSVDETAALCGVQDRTVRRWQSGATPIPDDAGDALEQLEDAMERAVDQAVKLAKAEAGRMPIALYRYRTAEDQARSAHASSMPPGALAKGGLPLGAHAMMIGWAADALAAEGVDVRIEWAP